MSRTSRVPYHQNVYDLLQLEPSECPEAARMIAEHEAAHGPLPASMREWYLVPNVVPLQHSVEWDPDYARGTRWFDTTGGNRPTSLDSLLDRLVYAVADSEFPYVGALSMGGIAGCGGWNIHITGSDDPPVLHDIDGAEYVEDMSPWTDTFSEFVFLSVCAPSLSNHAKLLPQKHSNGLWLRTPSEPFTPAVIDYLTEQLGEPERTPRPGNVTTYTFRSPNNTVRVTADEPELVGALSAWWVHADTLERLADLARLIIPFGTLRDTLRADTDPAREVLQMSRK